MLEGRDPGRILLMVTGSYHRGNFSKHRVNKGFNNQIYFKPLKLMRKGSGKQANTMNRQFSEEKIRIEDKYLL
jgi:hypothetical protein